MRGHTMPATPSSLTRRRYLQQLTALCVSTTCTMTTSAATPIATTPAEVASALSKAQLLGRATFARLKNHGACMSGAIVKI